MFTGIVEWVGEIRRLDPAGPAARIEIDVEKFAPEPPLAPGQSIAVNGCCLTVTEAHPGSFSADLSPETLHRTSFGQLAEGSLVNLERPLRAGQELGGHFVLGHVDGVARIERVSLDPENGWLAVRVGEELARYVARKGSLAIDGISLTVAACSGTLAEFAIIPFTFAHTNLHTKGAGDPVNLEVDVLARYLDRLLDAGAASPIPAAAERPRQGESDAASRNPLTLERLIEEGF